MQLLLPQSVPGNGKSEAHYSLRCCLRLTVVWDQRAERLAGLKLRPLHILIPSAGHLLLWAQSVVFTTIIFYLVINVTLKCGCSFMIDGCRETSARLCFCLHKNSVSNGQHEKNQQPSHHLAFSVLFICKVRKGNDLAKRLQQRSFAAYDVFIRAHD